MDYELWTMNYGLSSELIPEVQEEIRLLCAVAVPQRCSERPEHGLVVVSALHTKERLLVAEEVLQFLCLTSSSQAKQHIVVGGNAQLTLQLNGHELVSNAFDVAYAGKRHLLLQIMPEPITANGVGVDKWNGIAEEQTAIGHRLKREATTEGKRSAPTCIDIAHAATSFEFHEVVGQVGKFCLEAYTSRWEVPIVFAIIGELGTITDIMFIIELNVSRVVRLQFVLEMQVVPTQASLEVEVPEVMVEGEQLCLKLVVEDAVVVVATHIDVHIVATVCEA